MKFIDLTGQRFGRLIVISRAETKHGLSHWNVACDCGNAAVVAGSKMKSGHTTSCGCFMRESVSARRLKHGHTLGHRSSREYESWTHAKKRCLNPDAHHEKYYRSRGITMCKAWVESFESFLRDMGPRPPGTTLDRKDNDGNYEPGNCRWATRSEQMKNRGAFTINRRKAVSA
jgi:hypothetical protein